MPIVYRLTRAEYARTAFRGSRGRGRWHRLGTPVVYAADTPATALLETLVHTARTDLLASSYVVFAADVPQALIVDLQADELPPRWQSWPWDPGAQRVGSLWFDEQVSAVLSVPSAVVPMHRNYLLNPTHPDWQQVTVGPAEPFAVDTRLAGQTG